VTKGRNTAGSGGRIRKGLAGRGPTPKAEDRVYHKAHQATQRAVGQNVRPKVAGDWVVGRNAVLEALQAGLPVKTAYIGQGAERDERLRDILKYAAAHSVPLLQASRAELDRLTGQAVHQGVALLLPSYEYAELPDLLEDAHSPQAILVACDQVTDPHNLGAIIRSAAGFGALGVVIPARRSAKMTAAAWKASAGAAARLPVAQVVNLNRALEQCAAAGFQIVGLAGDGGTPIDQVSRGVPTVVVVGSEGAGLSRLVRQHCDTVAHIPIAAQLESLNVSVAAAVALYELTRGG
jgi:23S rRNA (guanosine2251-2'-O)-methyltransferase